jgi:hypothetical protein
MFVRHKARSHACALLLALAALATAGRAAAQSEPRPRKPQGPVAGPAIKLPRGAGAGDERARDAGEKEDEGQDGRAPWAPRKWEYCVVRGFKYNQKGLTSSSRTSLALVRYFPTGSDEVEGANDDEALGNAFAKLGEEGWELTGVRTDFSLNDGNGASYAAYFFKRPKRQE